MSLHRRAVGWALLGAGMIVVFLPFASVSGKAEVQQTLTLLALVLALAVTAVTWLALRGNATPVRLSYIAAAALTGSLAAGWWLRTHEGGAPDRRALAASLAVIAVINAVGFVMFTAGSRRAFGDRTRTLSASGIVFLCVALLIWPSLLLQPEAATYGLDDVQLQLRAGYRYWTIGAVILIAPFLALTTIPGEWFERVWDRVRAAHARVRPRQFEIAVAGLSLGLAIAISIYSFDRRPTTADEIAQLWHARIIAERRLSLPPDPNPEFFAVDNIIDRPRWFSQFPIGGPALLALGLAVNAAWLINPLVTALLVIVTYRFVRAAYDEAQARLAAAVLALSPMILIMGGTHMNHPPTALLVMVAFLAFVRWRQGGASPTVPAAILGGFIGLALMIRPLDAVIAGAVLGLSMLWITVRERRASRPLVVAALAGALPVALLLWANWRTTGDPLVFGYQFLWGPNHSLGLHDDPLGNPHTPWRAMLLAVKYAAQLNWIVTAWPIPVIVFVAAGLIVASRVNGWDVLLLSFVVSQIATYAFYWHDGQFVGPRFVFSAVPALVILAARAPFVVAERVRSGVWWRLAVAVIPVCLGVAWLRSMRPYGVQSLIAEFRETRTRLKIDPPADVDQPGFGPALIFVQEGTSSRLVHRLWGLGVSRPDAARIIAVADGCSLVEAVHDEELRLPTDTAGRLARIEQRIEPFQRSARSPRLADPGFRVSDSASVRGECAREVAYDYRVQNTVAYGPMLLRNEIDSGGRIGGRVVYALDLGVRNEVLRHRFGDRRWFRYELLRGTGRTEPVLNPYVFTTPDSARTVRNRPPK
ncbi:MAG TPA: hypothetical protein VEB19_04830 [Gemmatimonadaceae bacterium]|nr:hypothetical protein [Gemmatimonadaceae bacterium]